MEDCNRVRTLEDLEQCRLDRVSICTANLICGKKSLPAAVVMNMNAAKVLQYLRDGLFIYKPKLKGKTIQADRPLKQSPFVTGEAKGIWE